MNEKILNLSGLETNQENSKIFDSSIFNLIQEKNHENILQKKDDKKFNLNSSMSKFIFQAMKKFHKEDKSINSNQNKKFQDLKLQGKFAFHLKNVINTINDLQNQPKKNTLDYEQVYRKLKKINKIENSDDSLSGNEEIILGKSIINSNNFFFLLWECLIFIVVIYSCITVPFIISFCELEFSFLELFICIVLFTDIILNILVIKNIYKYTFKDNFIKYLKTWFIFDLLGIIPFNFFINENDHFLYEFAKLFRLFRCLKIFQKRNVNFFISKFENLMKININFRNVISIVSLFCELNHFSACAFHYLSKIKNYDESTWVYKLNFIDRNTYDKYIYSLLWTLTTITTVGYGDISGYSDIEKIYSIFIMITGIYLYSSFLGTLSFIAQKIASKRMDMKSKLVMIESIRKNFEISNETYIKIKKVIKFDTYKNQIDLNNFLKDIPHKLSIEISKIIKMKNLKNVIFFRNQKYEFYARIIPLLKYFVLFQNDNIYHPYDTVESMYFIGKGSVIYCLPKKYQEKEVRLLKKNWNFGEIEMCLETSINYSIKVRSKVAELYSFNKHDFLKLTLIYQSYIEKFLAKSLIMYMDFKADYYKAIEVEQLNKKFPSDISYSQNNNYLKKKISTTISKKLCNSKIQDLNKQILLTQIEEYKNSIIVESDKNKNIKIKQNSKIYLKRNLSKNSFEAVKLVHDEKKKIKLMASKCLYLLSKYNYKFPKDLLRNPYDLLNDLKKEKDISRQLEILAQAKELILEYQKKN